jgi:hypothetical protein
VSVSGDWIPTAAFIEHYVLEEALGRDVSIKKASATVVPRFGLSSNGAFLHRQTRLLGMLYTLLVFPRERWKRDGLIDVIVERARADSELSAANKKLLSLDFIRCIRNAVSHARIDFTDDAITFRDGKTEESLTFEETLSIREAMNLVLVLGRAFHESAQVKEALANVGRGSP